MRQSFFASFFHISRKGLGNLEWKKAFSMPQLSLARLSFYKRADAERNIRFGNTRTCGDGLNCPPCESFSAALRNDCIAGNKQEHCRTCAHCTSSQLPGVDSFATSRHCNCHETTVNKPAVSLLRQEKRQERGRERGKIHRAKGKKKNVREGKRMLGKQENAKW